VCAAVSSEDKVIDDSKKKREKVKRGDGDLGALLTFVWVNLIAL
jgi:hypothetical protein